MALVEGVTLYGLCLFLPSMIGMIMNLDRNSVSFLWEEVQLQICHRSTWICWNILGRVLPSLDDEEPEQLTFDNFASDTYLSDIYVIVCLTFFMALCRVLLVHILVPNNLAPQQMEALVRCKSIHLLSSEYKKTLTPRETPRSVITWESLNREFASKGQLQTSASSTSQPPAGLPSLPLLNLPDHDSSEEDGPTALQQRLETPTRARLSYSNDHDREEEHQPTPIIRRLSGPSTPTDDWELSMDTPVHNRNTISSERIQMGGFLGGCGPRDSDSDNRPLVDDSEHDLSGMETPSKPISMPMLFQQQRSVTPDMMDHADYSHNNIDEESLPWQRRGSTASLAAAAAAAVQEEEDGHSLSDDDNDNDMDHSSHPLDQQDLVDPLLGATTTLKQPPPVVRRKPQRLFAAPRYATAVFRLLYCACSCTMAWYLFRDADFWPSYVGGHGSTARCWDLSGSLALAKNLDSDFDHRNTLLRRFFLVQASYHLHSGAFHIFSVLLLFFLKDGGSDGEKQKKKKKDWLSLLRTLILPRAMLQHTLSLFFLSISYVFSSLRRLGAIGMFALDFSSLALHLLQTCLNAPSDSILSQKRTIRVVWALLVVPSFLYFRFYVWPMVGYSARVESEQWLAQLESTLVPGSASWFRWTFQTWMALWMGFHVIHFKRLFFHPHIQRIMSPSNEEASSGTPTKA
eukprot:Sro150_g068940.2  (686) ;mRNA; f:85138-87195